MEFCTPPDGGNVLDAERTETTTAPYWDGDLDHFTTRASARPGRLAAMVVAESGEARAWMNLRLCREQDRLLIWLRLRAGAARRACTVVMASDLAGLLLSDDREQLGA